MENNRDILCKICYYAVQQLEELYEVIDDMINNEKEAPEWLLKAAKRLTDMFSLSYSLYECRYVSSVLLFEYLVMGGGVPYDYIVKTYHIPPYTLNKALSLLEEAKVIQIYQKSVEKVILPLKPLRYIHDRLKALAQDTQGAINFEEWSKYLTLYQFIVLLRVLYYLVTSYISKVSSGIRVKKPRVIFEPFRILSKIIIKNIETASSDFNIFDYMEDHLNDTPYGDYVDLELTKDEILRLLSFLGNKKYVLRYLILSGGLIDGEAKLFVFDMKQSKVYVINDFKDYVLYMRERLRERERIRRRF